MKTAQEWQDDMNEYQRQQVKKFQIDQAGKTNIQTEQRSVIELQRDMEKMRSPKPPRGRHQYSEKNSQPIENEAKKKRKKEAKKRMLAEKNKNKNRSNNSPGRYSPNISAMNGSDGFGDHPQHSGILEDEDSEDDSDDEFNTNGMEEPEIHLGTCFFFFESSFLFLMRRIQYCFVLLHLQHPKTSHF